MSQDIVEIGMAVDSSQIAEAASATRELGAAWAKTVATIVAEENRLERAMKASAEVQAAAQDKVFGEIAQAELKKWATAQRTRLSMMKESEAIANKQAAAEAKLTQELQKQSLIKVQQRAETGFALGLQRAKEEAAAAELAAKAAAQEAAQLDYLNTKYDKAYAAAKLFKSIQDEISLAMAKGAGNAETLKLEMSKLEAEYAAFQGGTAQLGNRFNMLTQATEQSRKGVNRWGLLVQQTGYQAGDFLVQIQSGTNAFVAFGQQATQLVGILPMFSTELGVSAMALGGITLGLSIAIPLLTAIGAYFTRTGEKAKSGAKDVDIYSETIKGLTEEIKKNNEEFLKMKFGTDSFNVASASQQVEDLESKIKSLTENIARLKSYGGRSAAYAGLLGSPDEMESQKEALLEQLRILKEQESSKRTYNGLLAIQMAFYRSQGDFLRAHTKEGIALKFAQEATVVAGKQLAVVTGGMVGTFSSLSGLAGSIAGKMWDAAGAAATMRNLSGVGGRPEGGANSTAARQAVIRAQQAIAEKNRQDTAMGSSGGGGGMGGGNAAIESLVDSLKTEQEKIDEWYKISQTSLQSASDQELAIIGGRHEAELRLEEEHQKRLSEIKNVSQNTQLQDTATFFGGLAAVAQAGGDKMTKVARVFSAAQALTNSYLAFTQVLADPSLVGRPWARFGMAASALASGLQAVAAIKSGSSGSISSHGSVGTSSAAAAPAPQQVLIQGLKPTDMFSGEQLSSLFDSLYKENRNRGMVFMVQR